MFDLLADDNGDITYGPPAGSENGDGSDIEAETAESMPSTSAVLPTFVRRRRGRGRAGQGREGVIDGHTTLRSGRGSRFRFTDQWLANCRKYHSKYLMFVNWKLPYVVFGVCCIWHQSIFVFVGLLCCSMRMNDPWLHFPWKRYSVYLSMLHQI